MIALYHHVSGETLASELANDPEEASRFFMELTTVADDRFFADVAGHLDSTERQDVAAFLTLMAEKIGGTE
jgi:hypothetical protein